MLELNNLAFAYRDNKKRYEVFRGLNLLIPDNEFFCLVGPSGCGKTTLLNIIAGFESPTAGEVTFNGQAVSGISHERAVVFQEDAVFPRLNV